MLSAAEVAVTVGRLRAVAAITAAGVPSVVVSANERWVVQVGARMVTLPAGDVVDWCGGFAAAAAGVGQVHAGRAFFEVSQVLAAPSEDQAWALAELRASFAAARYAARVASGMPVDEAAANSKAAWEGEARVVAKLRARADEAVGAFEAAKSAAGAPGQSSPGEPKDAAVARRAALARLRVAADEAVLAADRAAATAAMHVALADQVRYEAAAGRLNATPGVVGLPVPAGHSVLTNVLLAVQARDLGLVSGSDFAAVTDPWVAAGLPLPASVEEDGDRLEDIAAVLDHPSRDDQCRMVILGLMHGVDGQRMSTDVLAKRVGKAKKTVVDALGFGPYLGSDTAEKMIAAFGMRWSLTSPGGAVEMADGGGLSVPLPEMPGLVALRRILVAARAGWLAYVDEPSLNKARWKPERDRWYRLTVGRGCYSVAAESMHVWLDGLAAFHAGQG
jgi:hypothetical protein